METGPGILVPKLVVTNDRMCGEDTSGNHARSVPIAVGKIDVTKPIFLAMKLR